MTFSEYLLLFLAAVGVIFTFTSSVGVLRLPGVFARMHAASKASTLGVSCLLLAAGLHFGNSALVRMLMLIALFYVTAPIAATAMARAAYRTEPTERETLNQDDLAADEMRRAKAH